MSGTAAERLIVARRALQEAHNRQGLRHFDERHIVSVASGIEGIEGNPLRIIWQLADLFKDPIWLAVVGISHMGWEAAARQGWDLSRTVIVDNTSDEVLSLLLEGFDVIVTSAPPPTPHKQQLLAAKARKLERRLFTTSPWYAVGDRRAG